MTKKCSKCNIEKDNTEYFFRNKEKEILHSICKDCKREIDRKSYTKNSNDRQNKIRESAIRNREKLFLYVDTLRKNSKCSKCNDSRHYVLDFHHLRDKKKQVMEFVNSGCSLELLKKEIEKCILLCSNCHRELHYFERMKDNGHVAQIVERQIENLEAVGAVPT